MSIPCKKTASTLAPADLAPAATRCAKAALLPFRRGLPMTTKIARDMILLLQRTACGCNLAMRGAQAIPRFVSSLAENHRKGNRCAG
jgi:hypothetical protein